MTEAPAVADRSVSAVEGLANPEPDGHQTRASGNPFDRRRATVVVIVVVIVLFTSAVVVVYGIGPLVHNRDQRSLQEEVRTEIVNVKAEANGLSRIQLPTQPPTSGSPVGILVIPALGLQQAVVEGVGPAQTVSAPGHVPGTAGLGQPGNTAVVGRRAGYGGPFGRLGQLQPGDQIVTATIEGQSVYRVSTVRTVSLVTPVTTPPGAPVVPGPASTVHFGPRAASRAPAVTDVERTDTLYGPTARDQLTLVSSASSLPWNGTSAVVVVARLEGQPYTPTPQESRSAGQLGTTGDGGSWATLLLVLLGLVAALAGAIALYRHTTTRAAYLLSTAPLLVLTVLGAEAASRLLPAWL